MSFIFFGSLKLMLGHFVQYDLVKISTSRQMEEGNVSSILTSAAAFVEGGIQEACDDACSICLEAFCDSEPSTV